MLGGCERNEHLNLQAWDELWEVTSVPLRNAGIWVFCSQVQVESPLTVLTKSFGICYFEWVCSWSKWPFCSHHLCCRGVHIWPVLYWYLLLFHINIKWHDSSAQMDHIFPLDCIMTVVFVMIKIVRCGMESVFDYFGKMFDTKAVIAIFYI